MVHTREELHQLADEYTSNTLSCIHTVQEFCGRHSKWLLRRETELEMMRDIMDRAARINLTSDHFKKSEKKVKAFGEFLWSKLSQVTAERRVRELEKELGCLLQDTLEGLEKLNLFLEAVEKLAVTSLSFFSERNPLCCLPRGTSVTAVRSVILAAGWACPLLIHYQRDDGNFFLPSLVCADLLAVQLDTYVRVSQELCEKFQKGEELHQLADEYTSNTLSCIHTVQEFCSRHSKWLLRRETELEMMRDIMDRAARINLTSDHFKKSEKKVKAFGEFLWSKLSQVTAERRVRELEKELGCLLQDTLEGLEKLNLFLEAVEKLAVTSLSFFSEGNPLCCLPRGMSVAAVRSIIAAAGWACPLLIHFQRDHGNFFLPSLVRADLLAVQLDTYVRVSQELCEKLQKSSETVSRLGMNCGKENQAPENDPCSNFTNEAIQTMTDHLTHLANIRLDHHFRMTYLFKSTALRFVGLFCKRSSRMRQFLEALEESAVQLDRMKMGASISSVAGSSVGFAGGILSIVGLALAPVTAGVSLTLTMAGVGLGVTSGVNSLATGITELSVNSAQGKKINEIFLRYKEDMETIQECLAQAAGNIIHNSVPDGIDVAAGVSGLVKTYIVGKGIDSIVDCASGMKAVLKSEEIASTVVKVASQEIKAARNVPNVVADLTDFGQLAKGTPLALTKSARAGVIALNSIFMGLDLFFICKDSVSLANGSKNHVSKFIRGRASLWKTELDAWEKVHRSLCIGIWRFRKSMEVLQRPFCS